MESDKKATSQREKGEMTGIMMSILHCSSRFRTTLDSAIYTMLAGTADILPGSDAS